MSEILAADMLHSEKLEAAIAARAENPSINAAMQGGEFNRRGSIAVIPVRGMMMKGFGFDGLATDTIGIKNKLRAAAKNDSIKGVMLIIDSPGGQVEGQASLIDTVRAVKKVKPVAAAIDDLGGSAAYWLASQADTVSVSRSGMVGSIGVFTVVRDTSEAFEKEGVKSHLVASGEFKGAGDGVPVSDEQIAEVQKLVDFHSESFKKEVAQGRDIPIEAIDKVATGQIFAPKQAKKLGLIDTIADVETALNNFKATLSSPDRGARIRRKLALAKHRRK